MKQRRTAILAFGLVALLTAGCSGSGSRPSAPAHSAEPAATTVPTPSLASSPAPTVRPSLPPLSDELPTRLVVADLEIDLPVVSGDLTVPGNPPDYPLCDVAQYLTIFRFPGRPGTTTWIYGHARPGMLLPLLEASAVDDGSDLIGGTVLLYSDAGNRFTYRITEVLRHATDRSAARGVPAATRRLVLQTSEGPSGTVPKLQVVAELVGVEVVPVADAVPEANPVQCFIE